MIRTENIPNTLMLSLGVSGFHPDPTASISKAPYSADLFVKRFPRFESFPCVICAMLRPAGPVHSVVPLHRAGVPSSHCRCAICAGPVPHSPAPGPAAGAGAAHTANRHPVTTAPTSSSCPRRLGSQAERPPAHHPRRTRPESRARDACRRLVATCLCSSLSPRRGQGHVTVPCHGPMSRSP